MHYFAIVLVSPDRAHELEKAVADAFAPFDEALSAGGDDQAPGVYWWDWWRVGGRWDGVVRGVDRGAACSSCAVGMNRCHYSDKHEQMAENAIPVLEMGECRPHTLITPDGRVSHREHYVPGAGNLPDWPWHREENANHNRFVGEALLANRDAIAVGIDYHN